MSTVDHYDKIPNNVNLQRDRKLQRALEKRPVSQMTIENILNEIEDDAAMLEHLEPFRPHRFRVVRLLQASGLKAPRGAPRRRLGPLPGRR